MTHPVKWTAAFVFGSLLTALGVVVCEVTGVL